MSLFSDPTAGDINIGTWSNIGPGGKYPGRLLGLKPISHLASDVAVPLAAAALKRRRGGKDYNDEPAKRNVGADQGRSVEEVPEP